jgi:hypothetical protein
MCVLSPDVSSVAVDAGEDALECRRRRVTSQCLHLALS